MLRTMQAHPQDREGALRSLLRVAMLNGRPNLEGADRLAVNRVYLEWLREADRRGDGTCRDLIERDIPFDLAAEDTALLDREREVALRGIGSQRLQWYDHVPRRLETPQWVLSPVRDTTGLSDSEIGAALGDPAHPQRCAIAEVMLRTALERPEDAPMTLLVGL